MTLVAIGASEGFPGVEAPVELGKLKSGTTLENTTGKNIFCIVTFVTTAVEEVHSVTLEVEGVVLTAQKIQKTVKVAEYTITSTFLLKPGGKVKCTLAGMTEAPCYYQAI